MALLGFQLAVHLDEGSWNAKAAPKDVAAVDGHLAEWEWFHPMEMVQVLAHPRALPGGVSSQNVYRFITPYGMTLFYGPTGSLYLAALVTSLLSWAAAGWAGYVLATKLAPHAESGIVAVALAGTAPGFIAYFATIDAHPTGYAATAAWLAAVEALRLFDPPPPPAAGGAWRGVGSAVARPALAGVLLCVAGYAMEVAYPLLLFAWIFYGVCGLLRQEPAATVVRRLLVFTAAWAIPYIGFRLAVEQVVPLPVFAFNEPFAYVRGTLAQLSGGGLAWLADNATEILARWPASHPPLISLLALVGFTFAPWRWRLMAVTWVLVFAAAVAFTRQAVRDVYFTWPVVYPLAALGLTRLAQIVAGPPGRWSERDAAGARTAARVRLLVTAAVLVLVLRQINADLWGDYYLPYRWYVAQ